MTCRDYCETQPNTSNHQHIKSSTHQNIKSSTHQHGDGDALTASRVLASLSLSSHKLLALLCLYLCSFMSSLCHLSTTNHSFPLSLFLAFLLYFAVRHYFSPLFSFALCQIYLKKVLNQTFAYWPDTRLCAIVLKVGKLLYHFNQPLPSKLLHDVDFFSVPMFYSFCSVLFVLCVLF